MSTTDLRRGPFINEDGDVWVPVTVGGIAEAWRTAYEYPGDKLNFVGMDDGILMSMHEFPVSYYNEEEEHREECEFKDQWPCTWTGRAYHFREAWV